ncbi:MAG: hypothetical protein MJY67_02820 [Bacteroidales bacterium]|nr:hypothetical protein [Bacteroidales bacterium]
MSFDGNLTQIAKVLKSNGTDGELVMSFATISPEELPENEPVFIYFDGLPVPFFIESLTKRGATKALVHLTDIKSSEDALEIAGAAVYMREDAFEEEYDEDDFSFLVGWDLLDSHGLKGEKAFSKATPLGKVSDFIDIPANPCLEIEYKNGPVLIPLHEDLIAGIDSQSRCIYMHVPEGLLE